MPLASYDRYFGGKKRAAEKAHKGMIKQYGYAEGTRIFYALLADRRKEARKRSR
jgi:hypothetical protein